MNLDPLHLKGSYGDDAPVEREYPDLAKIVKNDATSQEH